MLDEGSEKTNKLERFERIERIKDNLMEDFKKEGLSIEDRLSFFITCYSILSYMHVEDLEDGLRIFEENYWMIVDGLKKDDPIKIRENR